MTFLSLQCRIRNPSLAHQVLYSVGQWISTCSLWMHQHQPGVCFKMQSLGPTPCLIDQKLGMRSRRLFWQVLLMILASTLILESHCSRAYTASGFLPSHLLQLSLITSDNTMFHSTIGLLHSSSIFWKLPHLFFPCLMSNLPSGLAPESWLEIISPNTIYCFFIALKIVVLFLWPLVNICLPH